MATATRPRENAGLVIEHLTKIFGGSVKAIDDVSLTIEPGELVSFLGPSGCGKTTTLNCIAGLEHPDHGVIRVGDFVMTDTERKRILQPEERKLGMVFQSYALWPHMTVADNVGFGLRITKVPRDQIKRRVSDILELVGLGKLGDRYPFQLSGGQQQRVALARAVVAEPRLLLLDEPLSNLDARVREQARVWLREIQKRLGITTVYVTHDQSEALAMSDKIAVMSAGHVEQFATPQEVYESPASRFVAEFIGATAFLKGTVVDATPQGARVRLPDDNVLTSARTGAVPPRVGDEVSVAIRSERVQLASDGRTENVITGRITLTDYLGSKWHHTVETSAGKMMIETLDHADGDVRVYLPPDAVIVLKE
ncbi:MAG TPA: ABC transporter ATP-binding protein [Herpetosiphonaceae bacterium]|nr:ABC transporter ATP-binding protein [Herpetosiphonaceae bacterium]